MGMKVLTIKQPWASLWLTARKVHETRGWRTNYRGPLAVHAGKRKPYVIGSRLDALCITEFGLDWRDTLPCGAIIGVVDLVNCYSTNEFAAENVDDLWCGDFTPDRWLWRRGAAGRLARPVNVRGHQGLWTWDLPPAFERLGHWKPLLASPS
jgi:activating signal cointegrator 1